ncbi:hypothetical protein BST17_24890 [Mycolicibacterium bacteremicum]|uniref:Uncharacterized protein n=1 Tax=Mycolicibacterium bacteremicum TaxID=564198 RepID=A0A1W9YQT0_MYCBA|nr:hypothetical protein BST17_24890 [Mycolicibacterium bacteremicum]
MAVSFDALVDLTTNAVGYGVMMALESRDELLRKLQAAGPNTTMWDVLKPDAESFLRTRTDLVERLNEVTE